MLLQRWNGNVLINFILNDEIQQISPVSWSSVGSSVSGSSSRMKELRKRRSDFLGLDPAVADQGGD